MEKRRVPFWDAPPFLAWPADLSHHGERHDDKDRAKPDKTDQDAEWPLPPALPSASSARLGASPLLLAPRRDVPPMGEDIGGSHEHVDRDGNRVAAYPGQDGSEPRQV